MVFLRQVNLFWIGFLIHSSIEFLSRTVSFQPNMKWVKKKKKVPCVAIADWPVLKKTFPQQMHSVQWSKLES